MVKLRVSFFDERDPYLSEALAPTEHWSSSSFVAWDSRVNDDVNPLEVLEERKDPDALLPVEVEHRWVDSF